MAVVDTVAAAVVAVAGRPHQLTLGKGGPFGLRLFSF